MTIGWHFDNTYSKLSKTFIEDIKPTPVHDPELVILNEQLAEKGLVRRACAQAREKGRVVKVR